MNTSIITSNINSLQFNELRDTMQDSIKQSMEYLDSHDAEHLMWYEDCSMEDYFTMWTEIWDDDTLVGEGLETIAHKFVLNNDTRSDFENAFAQARDAAFEEYMKDLAEEICDGYSNVSMEDVTPEEDGEVEGYERIGDDSQDGAHFLGSFDGLYTALYNHGDSINPIAFAAWLGATAYGESGEYSFYYKRRGEIPSRY